MVVLSVGRSVGLFIGYDHVFSKNGWGDAAAVWGCGSDMGPRYDVLDEVTRRPHGRENNFWVIGWRSVTYRKNAVSALQKRVNRLSCRL